MGVDTYLCKLLFIHKYETLAMGKLDTCSRVNRLKRVWKVEMPEIHFCSSRGNLGKLFNYFVPLFSHL